MTFGGPFRRKPVYIDPAEGIETHRVVGTADSVCSHIFWTDEDPAATPNRTVYCRECHSRVKVRLAPERCCIVCGCHLRATNETDLCAACETRRQAKAKARANKGA